MERLAALQKTPFVRVLKLVFFTVLALYSAIAGSIELAEQFTTYNDYQWHTSNPEKDNRCVPFFDKATVVAKDTDSFVMYNYNLENATVIFCTDKPRSSFDSELSSGKFYDQLDDVSHGNCSLATASNATCVPTPTCVAPELNIAPVPYGVMWEYEIEGTNATNFTTPCGAKFTKMDMTYEACSKAHVHVYRYSAGSGAYLVFMISIIYVIVRFGLELAGVIAFHKQCCNSCGKEGKDSVLFGIAAGGLFGPLYSFGELITKRDVSQITEAADLPLPVEVVLLFLDTLPSVVLPIYAMSGCSFSNLKLVLLLIFGLVKTTLSLIKTIYDLVGTHCSDKKSEPLDGKDTILTSPLLIDQGGNQDTYNPAQSTMSSPLSPHHHHQHHQGPPPQVQYQQQRQAQYSPHHQQQQHHHHQQHQQQYQQHHQHQQHQQQHQQQHHQHHQQQPWAPPQNQPPQSPHNSYIHADSQIEL